MTLSHLHKTLQRILLFSTSESPFYFKMSSKSLFSFLFLLVLPFSSSSDTTSWIKSGFWYAGSVFPIPEIPSNMYTHLHVAYAYINTSNFEIYISQSDEPYISTFTQTVKQSNPSIITLLSILGGNDDESPAFFAMTSEFSRRKSFITTSIKTALRYGFQGLDLIGVKPNTAANMTNMRTFIEEWRRAINSESNRLILTMGAHYSPMLDDHQSIKYPVHTIVKNFDWIHLRAYDYYVPTKTNVTRAHSALYDPTSTRNTDYGVREWIKSGVPANKIVIGLAYHGYTWTLVNPNHNTVGSPVRGLAITADGAMNYRKIKSYMKSYGAIPVYNSSYVVNYVTIGSSWIGYDDVEAIRTKVSYAKDKGLRGFAAFQVPSDDVDWKLSKAASNEEEEEDQRDRKRTLLAILLPTITITILLTSTIVCILKKKTIRSKGIEELNERAIGRNPIVFSFDQIKEATENFSFQNKVGEGGFGPVYKGSLSDGQEIAVKRLSECSKQGVEEFQNEVSLASKLQHVNVLQLQGFCIEKDEKILIYEYMPNKSLDFYLYDPVKSLKLDWETRVSIIEGVTQGLLYLQEYSTFTVIHRDLKASNILLDDEMKPKISDFGIARLFQKDENEANTGKIVGTYGCVPPEYVKRGVYSRKYDVYSFGVLLLQILGGKKNSCEYGIENDMNLLEYAYELWQKGDGVDFLDPSMQDDFRIGKQLRYMQVALLCVQEKWEDRPSMLEVYSMLKNESEILPNPKVPAFSKNKDSITQETLVTVELDCSNNSLTISQLIAR